VGYGVLVGVNVANGVIVVAGTAADGDIFTRSRQLSKNIVIPHKIRIANMRFCLRVFLELYILKCNFHPLKS
jgi:hypothetical protein